MPMPARRTAALLLAAALAAAYRAKACEAPGPGGQPVRQGPAREWYDAEHLRLESTWRDGQLDGPYVELYRGGRKSATRAARFMSGPKRSPPRWWKAPWCLSVVTPGSANQPCFYRPLPTLLPAPARFFMYQQRSR